MRARVLLSPTSTPCLISLQLYPHISCTHIHLYIQRRQLNFSCVYSCRLVRGSRRVSTGLLLSLYASPHWLHTCMRAVRMYVYICVCVCGGRLRCEETTERVFGSEEDRYRPVECPGEDWTRKRTRWKQDHGCEPVSPPFRYPLCVTLSLSLPPPDLSPPSVRPRPRTLFVTGSPAPLLSLSLRVETLEHRRADSTRRPTDNQYAGRPVLSPAKSSFSHVPSFPFFPSDRFLSNLRRPTLRRSSNISPSWIYPSFFIYIYIYLSFSCKVLSPT